MITGDELCFLNNEIIYSLSNSILPSSVIPVVHSTSEDRVKTTPSVTATVTAAIVPTAIAPMVRRLVDVADP